MESFGITDSPKRKDKPNLKGCNLVVTYSGKASPGLTPGKAYETSGFNQHCLVFRDDTESLTTLTWEEFGIDFDNLSQVCLENTNKH